MKFVWSIGFITLLSALILVFVHYTKACELHQTQHGCRIDNGQCTCAHGCKSEFRYASRRECQDALRGRSTDICSQTPCRNGGICIQVSYNPGYKCKCLNGYFGNRCQRKCPEPNTPEAAFADIPWECALPLI